MSTTSTPADSPVVQPTDSPVIQPMHIPAQAAVVQQPQAPLGNATNGLFHAPGQGIKAILAKRLASKAGNPKYISPTDTMLTPCTAKISQSKKKHFNKGKPIQLFMKAASPPELPEESPSTEVVDDDEGVPPKEDQLQEDQPKPDAMLVDDESPF